MSRDAAGQKTGPTTDLGSDRTTGATSGPTVGPTRRRPRLRTLVFGLLLGLIAVVVLISETTGEHVDGAALAIAALIGSGLILIAGAVGAARQGERSG